ncbi:hypothetical protein HZD82_25280, partial [Pantoea agglomerans]|nr:hypothetical protein [Pantoea agglomerans]
QSQAPTSSQSNDGITPTTPAPSNGAHPNYDLSTIIIDYKQQDDLPLIFQLIGVAATDQRSQRIGQRDEEGIKQTVRHRGT